MLILLSLFHSLIAVVLAIYGANALFFSLRYGRGRRHRLAAPPAPPVWPHVTVQAPIFNEIHVVERLMRALAALDYPHDRLHIQLLDDSTDETTALAVQEAERQRSAGIDVCVLHRSVRGGFKAGALAAALPQTQGDIIAIFDADFVPHADFLRRTVPVLLADAQAGFVQTRWSHLNAGYSWLTTAQALALDGHFVVEQSVRQRSGWFFGFNGTAGLWRRQCIEAAGGWQSDTLCEDLDLSYRAQLAGWRGLYLPDVDAPAEIPPQLAAFKRQQARWATGSIQAFRKLAAPVARSRRPLSHRIEGLIHLGAYFCHPLMLLLLLLTLPLLWFGDTAANPLRWLMAYLSFVSLGPPLLYTLSQHELHPPRTAWARLAALPLLVLLGTGMAVNNSVAVLRGLSNRSVAFQRTPKFHVEAQHDAWQGKAYALPLNWLVAGESTALICALLTVAVAWQRGQWYALPFLLVQAGGFAAVVMLGVWQGWQRRAPQRRRSAARAAAASLAMGKKP
ncbi:MAG: glycosyltransferase [Caldilineales bacterium]